MWFIEMKNHLTVTIKCLEIYEIRAFRIWVVTTKTETAPLKYFEYMLLVHFYYDYVEL